MNSVVRAHVLRKHDIFAVPGAVGQLQHGDDFAHEPGCSWYTAHLHSHLSVSENGDHIEAQAAVEDWGQDGWQFAFSGQRFKVECMSLTQS